MKLYENIVRPTLFSLTSPEFSHFLALRALALMGMEPLAEYIHSLTCVSGLEREVFGLRFPNPVGLAAGFDKDFRVMRGIKASGFGFLEGGTVVPLPQAGNPKPRLFRLSEDSALINRMSFNSRGLNAAVRNLAKTGSIGIPIGVNFGKNRTSTDAVADYRFCIRLLYAFADYLVANISSPNTAGLRQLQRLVPLFELIRAMQEEMRSCAQGLPLKPLLIKIAPDLNPQELEDIAIVVRECGVSGVIATNTTLQRLNLQSFHQVEDGGLSGKPLHEQAVRIVDLLKKLLPDTPVIGVGGIFTGEDGQRMFRAGASLIQIFTSFIYGGPMTAHNINQQIKLAA